MILWWRITKIQKIRILFIKYKKKTLYFNIYSNVVSKYIDIDKIISLQHYKSYIRQDHDLKYQEIYFYDEFQWVMDQKVMEVKKSYILTKSAILYYLESNFALSWDIVSSNHEKEYFLRKLISSVK